ncbi:MAG: hypothetical protein ACTHK0_03890 [Ginsengibacter sp.]
MNFQTMSKQRKFVLISAAIGFISMFLPWVSISILGYSQSVNGMHDKGIVVFIGFVAVGLIAWLGDQTKNLDKTMWTVTLLAGAVALLLTIWFYSEATSSIMGSSLVGFGVYIAAIASIGILASAYLFKSPGDNLKDGFNSMKRNIENKLGSAGSVSTNTQSSSAPSEPPSTAVTDDETVTPVL